MNKREKERGLGKFLINTIALLGFAVSMVMLVLAGMFVGSGSNVELSDAAVASMVYISVGTSMLFSGGYLVHKNYKENREAMKEESAEKKIKTDAKKAEKEKLKAEKAATKQVKPAKKDF